MSDAFELGASAPAESNQIGLSMLELYTMPVAAPEPRITPGATTQNDTISGGEDGGDAFASFMSNFGQGFDKFAHIGSKHALFSTWNTTFFVTRLETSPRYGFYAGATGTLNAAVGLMNLSDDAPKLLAARDWSTATQYGLQSTGDLMMLGGGVGMMFPQLRAASTIVEFGGIGLRLFTPMFFPNDPDEKK